MTPIGPMLGAYLTGTAVGLIVGLLVAAFVIGHVVERAIDRAVTLPDPRRSLADEDTARIDPSEFPHDLRRSTRSWTA